MSLKMFKALLPYYGGKRRLCPIIFKKISEYLPRDKWTKSVFVDAFLGSGAVSLYAKAQGFHVVANDIAERSFIAGKALIENNQTLLTDDDLHRLCSPNGDGGTIEKEFVPDVFTRKHARFLDTAFRNAKKPLEKYVLLKYIFAIRPYSKFSSPNAFNRPMEEGRLQIFNPALDRAGLRRVPFHALRHTNASVRIANGEHPKYIQLQLGHASSQMTLDLYGHWFPQTGQKYESGRNEIVFGLNHQASEPSHVGTHI